MASTNPARGMRDFLPADIRKRNYVIGIIKEVYESYGFEPLETPAVENLETLTGKYGEEGNQLIYKILKRGEKLDIENASKESDLSDLALRYDLTVPLARVVANNKNELPKFFKRYQIQPVWRADRPARGRFREFYQCDVDCIGSESMIVEAEIVSAINNILIELGFDDFIIRINHREYLDSLAQTIGIPELLRNDAFVALDKLDKIGIDGVASEMTQRGLDENLIERFLEHFRKYSQIVMKSLNLPETDKELLFNEYIDALRVSDDGTVIEYGLDKLMELISLLGPLRRKVRFDPTLIRGLSYYTGTIMEINVPDLAGSLGGGGRYDGLIGMFGKEQIPACGFSLGLERILVVMEERGMFPPEIAESTPADVLVTIWSDETVADSLKLANELRGQGLRVTLYPEADKLGKQLKYADSIKVPFVCILGPEEAESGLVKLKNLLSGEENSLPATRIAAKIGR